MAAARLAGGALLAEAVYAMSDANDVSMAEVEVKRTMKFSQCPALAAAGREIGPPAWLKIRKLRHVCPQRLCRIVRIVGCVTQGGPFLTGNVALAATQDPPQDSAQAHTSRCPSP